MSGQANIADDYFENIERLHQKLFEQYRPEGDEELERNIPEHPIFELSRGYKKAGDLVSARICENYNAYNASMIPAALYLYRHSIELALKFMRVQLSERISKKYAYGKDHGLRGLWQPIEGFFREMDLPFNNGTVPYHVARTIDAFEEIDADGQLFRYADVRSEAAKNWIKVEFPALRLSISDIDLLAFGFHELVDHFISLKRSGEAENVR